jgi:hypothetical protein
VFVSGSFPSITASPARGLTGVTLQQGGNFG